MTAAALRTPVELGAAGLSSFLVSGPVHVGSRSVVVNLADTPAQIGGEVAGVLPPGRSTMLHDVGITGEDVLVIGIDQRLCAEHMRAQGWHAFYGDDATTELLRGPQVALGERRLDLGTLLASPWERRAAYEVRVNLWFAPVGTACGIHNQHDFLEFHTQVWGIGVMQKFHAALAPAPYEEQALAPGATGAAPFCLSADDWTYPWHQYAAQTDSVWLAVEYHAVRR